MPDSYDDVLARFEAPTAAYRPMMFWVWNGDLDHDRITAQVNDMADKGCGGFFIHPMGEGFRLNDFLRGIAPEYLSEGYFQAVRWAVEAAAERGLYAWLYDEGGWPSGNAQGHVLKGHPEHTAHVLRARRRPIEGGAVVDCPVGTVAVLAAGRSEAPQVVEPCDGAVTAPADVTEVVFFVAVPVEGRADLLSHAAVRRFIEVTHEQYAAVVGEFFGGVIPGIFTDEPAVPGRVGTDAVQWTDGLLDSFRERKGFDLRPFLPAIFAEEAVAEGAHGWYEPQVIAQVRCAFYDHWTDLFHEAYWRQINDWCDAHNLVHTGHVGGEDNLPDHARHGFGHFFKTAGALHAPGVDAIWRQLKWGEDNFPFPLFAASAAHQRPGQGGAPDEDSPFDNLVITETNGVYGLGLTFEQMRWLVDYQCLQGVNLIAPMAYSYETSGGCLFRTQDHMGPGNPLWELYREFADYIGRLCSVLRSGVALADIAVYYPIEAFWADPEGEGAAQAWRSVQEITRALQEEQVAFDFIDAGAIGRATISEGAMETDGQFYGTLLVPQTSLLPVGVARRLEDLHEAGGRVAFAGAPPAMCSDVGADEDFAGIMGRLAALAHLMDMEQDGMVGGDTRAGLDEAARWDGFASGFGMPRHMDSFPAELMAEQAVIIAPEGEVGRLARLLAVLVGRYSVQPADIVPDLRLSVRDIHDAQVSLLMNEGAEAVAFELDVIADTPSYLELWDAADGKRHLIAVHEEVSEATRVVVQLRPAESALLVLSPQRHEPPGDRARIVRPRRPLQNVVIDSLDEPTSVRILREFRIHEGEVQVVAGPAAERQLPARLGTWDLLGLSEFSGTVRYEFTFRVAGDYLAEEVFLDLGEVFHAAEAHVNGVRLPACLWRPHVLEVTRYLKEHDNSLQVLVTNTLANQVCREETVREARDRGWFNTYFERALPMMRESLPSGLVGPVRLYVRA